MNLWISNAVGPDGQPWGTLAVIADTREEAIKKAMERLEVMASQDPDAERYRKNMLENLWATTNQAIFGDVFLDADPHTVKRYVQAAGNARCRPYQ